MLKWYIHLGKSKHSALTYKEFISLFNENNEPGRTTYSCLWCGRNNLPFDEFGETANRGRRVHCKTCKNNLKASRGKLKEPKLKKEKVENLTCSYCNRKDLTRTDFNYSGNKDGRREYKYSKCRECLRANRYGISFDELGELLSLSKEFGCFICGRESTTKTSSGKNYVPYNIDHCHRTGKIRGLLCRSCNSALGHFMDNPIILRHAAGYVERANFKDFHPVESMKRFVEQENSSRYLPQVVEIEDTAYYQVVR